MHPDSPERRRARLRPPPIAVVLLLSVAIPFASAFANDLLRVGEWEGSYRPPKSGDTVPADFTVRAVPEEGGEAKTWAVDMSLRLPEPLNRKRAFLEIEDVRTERGDRELHLVLDMNPKVACHLTPSEEGEFSGPCYEGKWGDGTSGLLTMKPPSQPASEDSAVAASVPAPAAGDGSAIDVAAGAEAAVPSEGREERE